MDGQFISRFCTKGIEYQKTQPTEPNQAYNQQDCQKLNEKFQS